jgi:hypothetical protein
LQKRISMIFKAKSSDNCNCSIAIFSTAENFGDEILVISPTINRSIMVEIS